jgi:hypothetical protein
MGYATCLQLTVGPWQIVFLQGSDVRPRADKTCASQQEVWLGILGHYARHLALALSAPAQEQYAAHGRVETHEVAFPAAGQRYCQD